MEGGRHRRKDDSGSETPVEEVAMESPAKKEDEKEKHHRHRHHRRHHHHREKERSRDKKHRQSSSKDKVSSREKRRSPPVVAPGVVVSLPGAQMVLPLSPSSDEDVDYGASSVRSVTVDQKLGVLSTVVQQKQADMESSEIEEGEITEEGEVQGEIFMDNGSSESLEDKLTSLSKKRKCPAAGEETEGRNARTKISRESPHESEAIGLAGDDEDVHGERNSSRLLKSSHSDKIPERRKDESREAVGESGRSRSRERDAAKLKDSVPVKASWKSEIADGKRRSPSRENLDRKRGSQSRESVREKKRDATSDRKGSSKSVSERRDHKEYHRESENCERNRRSGSRESQKGEKGDGKLSRHRRGETGSREEQVRSRAGSPDRRHRSRSRESMREAKVEESLDKRGGGDRGRCMDRRRRSRSRESHRDHKVEESAERRGRILTRESVERDGRRNSERADDKGRRNDHGSSRHGRGDEILDRGIKEGVDYGRGDGADRKRRSRSRESLRERRGGSRSRGYGDDYQDREIRRDNNDRRNHHDGNNGRNVNIQNASRDRSSAVDRHDHRDWKRDRDGGYGNHYDHGDRGYPDRTSREEATHKKEEKAREEEDQEEYQERIESQLAAQEEDDVERIKEESRCRRQAILDKYKQQQSSKVEEEKPAAVVEVRNSKVPEEVPFEPTGQLESKGAQHAVEQTVNGLTVNLEKGNLLNGDVQKENLLGSGGLGHGSPKSERSADMFCDDIFGESPAGGRRVGKGDGLAIDTSGLTDNWDDAEGRYCFRIGEILEGRYEVLSAHGSGVFSTVVRARDMKAGRNDPDEVAIKIIRNNETMFRTGQQELVILRKLAGADPENRRHCVRLLSSFEYRNHLCLVFESLHMNLREILKKFGRNIGINLTAVRAYAKQLFIALKHLRNCGVLHCDIKPDNMLVNDAKNLLKLCDFGSAMFAGENEITPYLVSRFYRAPEIILGLPYDHALDVWSVGCCLYELYSGKMLFPGHTNNDMLRLHMELKGPFPKKMLKKAQFTDQHFDQDYNFCAVEEDPVTKKMVKRIVVNVKPKDMAVLVGSSGSVDEDSRTAVQFKDMLEKIFILDPDKRMTVSQALNHPFITGK